MMELVATVFIASLLGSLHCAGMCGPFVAVVMGGSTNTASQIKLHLAYHGGRLTTYMLLGAGAGGLGALVDMTSTLAGLQPLAMAIAGGLMIAMGVAELLRYFGHRIGSLRLPKGFTQSVQRAQRFALALRPTRRALVIGLLTTLLPCGWLYAFAFTAAGTGDPLVGAFVMAIFWVGTLPVMVSLGAGVRAALGVLGKRLPAVCAVALIVVGLTTLAGRLQLEPAALAQAVEDLRGTGTATTAAPDPNQLPPCCREPEQAGAMP